MKRINQKKQRLWQLILLALLILLAGLTPVYAAGEESVGRGEKGSGEFVLMAADENGFIIAPEYVSYEEDQTIRQALSASGHSFAGLEDGWIQAVDGQVFNISYFYDGGSYDLNAPAADIHKAIVFTWQSEDYYSEETLDLIMKLAAYPELDEEMRAFGVVRRAYEAAFQHTPTANKVRMAELLADVLNAEATYEAWKAETPCRVTFDVRRGGTAVTDLTIRVTDSDENEFTPAAGEIALDLRSGSYTFLVERGQEQVEGSFTVAAGSATKTVQAELPADSWFGEVTFYDNSSPKEALRTEMSADGSTYTVYVPDHDRYLNCFVAPGTSIAGQEEMSSHRWYAEYIRTTGTPYGIESETTHRRAWNSPSASLPLCIEAGIQGREDVRLKVVYTGPDGFIQRQYREVQIIRTPSLDQVLVKEAGGTVLSLNYDYPWTHTYYDTKQAQKVTTTDQLTGKGFDARVKAYTVYTTAANVLVQGLTRRTVSGVTFGTPEDGYQVFVNGSEQPAGGSISIPANAGTPAVVTVTTPNGESETIQLTVIQQEAVTLELTKESAAVSTSLVSETGSVLYPESQTAQRAVFRVLPGTYTWVGTVSSYYHTRGTVTCGATGGSAAVATPVVEQLVTTLDAGMRASLTYQEADGKSFSWQEHEYRFLVPDSATTFNLYFSGSAKTFVRGSYVNTDGALAEESSKTPSAGATSNLAASKFITSGAGNNEVIFRAERTVGNVCYYQEYFLATIRVPVLNNLAAAADTGHLVKADLKQQGDPAKGFDPLVNAYTVTVPQGAAALELTATYSAINDPGDGFYSLSVGGEAVARPQSAGSKVLRAPLDPEEEQETITFTVDTGMPENVRNQYVIVVIKSPPARVSFALTPADANLFILDNNTGEIINREADGSYELITGGSYTYTATAFGYIGEENADYMPLQAETITIALEKAPVSADLDPGLQADWPRFRFDAENNGVIDYPTPVQAEQATLYWAAKVGEGYGASATGCPILVGDYIYTYAGKSLIRIDRYTGEVDREHVGQMKTNSSFAINSPTYAQGMIFVALANGYVQAFNAETMESVWLYQAPHKGQPNCPIAYHDGYIYTGFWNSEVQGADFVCLSVTDEDPERTDERKCASWIIYDKGFYWAGAYVGPGSYPGHTYIVVGTEDGTIEGGSGAGDLLSLDRHTGRVIDRYAGICDSDIRSSIVFNEEDGKYYFTSKGGWFCSIRLKQDGTFDRSSLRKLYLAASNIYTGNRKPMSTSTPCIYNGRAYIGVSGNEMFGPYSGHNITVIDLASFRIAYTVPTQGYPQTSGLTTTAYDAGDGTVYVYFIDNYTPGKLRVIKDRPGQTAPDQLILDDGTHQAAYTLFTPYAQQAQFAICSPIADRDGNLFFKNDSAYMMMVGPTMTKLTVTRPPRKTIYDIGESFDPAGMVVTATYANGVTRDVTKYVTCREEAFSAAEAGSVTLDLILDLGANMCLYQDRNGKAGQEYTLPSTFVNVEVAHTWQKPVWKWTGLTAAKATFICAVDQTHQKTVSAKITEQVKEATVEADGEHTYTATVTGPDGKVYTDRKREVIPRIPPDTITLTKKNVTVKNVVYNGAAQKPVVVKDDDKTLKEGTDYTATYKKNKNVGTATVTVKGKGDYTGTVTKTFKITPASVKKAKVSGLAAKTYTGAAIKAVPVVKLTLNGKTATLKAGTDYTVTYKNNTAVGTATVTITGKGNFKDALSKTFKIDPASIKNASVGAVKDQIYDAQAKQPAPAVKLGLNGKTITLKSGTDYTVRYKNNTAPGTATITFTGKGNFTGTVSKTFKIVKEAASYERIFGDNRYETSFRIADALKKELGVSKFNCAVVADGRNYPDALAASYLASVKKAPILMTAEGRFADTVSYIRKNVVAGSTVYVIGGTGSVPESFTASLTGYQVKRLGGANRYGTNLLILNEARVSDQEILVVTGADFGDALSASATGKPVLLVGGSHLTTEQQSYLATLKSRKYTIVGGTEVVAAEIQADLARYGAVSRLGGATVYDRSVNIAKKYFPGYQKHITLASGESFPDGLAGGVLAMAKGGPLLLSNGSPAVYAKAVSYAKAANTTQATICGGGANEQMVTDQAVKAILAIK